MNNSLPSLVAQPSTNHSSGIIIIVILSILSFFGVIFMIFGPMMRSEAMKRIDNYIFGRSSDAENQMIDGMEYYDD
jgi:hypothetical protein